MSYLCAVKGAKELSVNVENFVFDIYHNFRRSGKLKKQLSDFMNFSNNAIDDAIGLLRIIFSV